MIEDRRERRLIQCACPSCQQQVEAELLGNTAYIRCIPASVLHTHADCDLRLLYATLATAAQILFPLMED